MTPDQRTAMNRYCEAVGKACDEALKDLKPLNGILSNITGGNDLFRAKRKFLIDLQKSFEDMKKMMLNVIDDDV
jgi:hypothetical protein